MRLVATVVCLAVTGWGLVRLVEWDRILGRPHIP